MKQILENKIDKLKEEMKIDINNKIKVFKDEISLSFGMQASRIDQVVSDIKSLTHRVSDIEKCGHSAPGGQTDDNATANGPSGHAYGSFRPGNSDDISVVAYDVQQEPGETNDILLQKANNIINSIDNDVGSKVGVTKATRFKTRLSEKPDLVKITFRNCEEKILV